MQLLAAPAHLMLRFGIIQVSRKSRQFASQSRWRQPLALTPHLQPSLPWLLHTHWEGDQGKNCHTQWAMHANEVHTARQGGSGGSAALAAITPVAPFHHSGGCLCAGVC